MPGLSARLRALSLVMGLVVPLVVGAPGRAQEAPPSPPTFELQEVEVAGKRPQLPSTTPASISVITADEIAAMGTALTVADVLRVLPETLIKDSGGPGSLTTVAIRGMASTRVVILLDGIPLNRPDQPSVDLSTLPIQDVDHIEVLRGPFSAIYGSSALGGVINIVTRTALKTTFSGRTGSFGESSDTVSLGGEVGGLTYLTQGILTGSTGFAPDTDYSNSTSVIKLHWTTAEEAGVTLTLNRLWHVVGSPGSNLFTPQDFLARTWEGRTLLDLTWRAGRPDGPGATLRLYAQDDDVAFNSPGSAFLPSRSDDVAHLWGAQGQWVFAPGPGNLLTLGAEYQGQVIAHTDNSPTTFSGQNNDSGLYLQDDWQITPVLLFSAAVREDTFALSGTQVNPRIGLVDLLSDRLTLRAEAGRGFRPPSFDELFLCGNSSLQPESASSYDIGLDYSLASGLAAHFTGYYTDATNLITFVSSLTPPCFGQPQNVLHAIVTGGSLEIVGRLNDQWFIRANYTNQWARDAATGLDIIYAPHHLATLELTYQLAPGTDVNASVNYVGDRFDNTTRVPGYWLTSLTITWPIGGIKLQAGVINLFDVPYQESLGFPEPGRRYFVTATTSF
jgi:outer membrane cobalamin receptor